MIEYFLDLADECILITYWKESHKTMLSTLKTMKNNLKTLKGVKQDERKA